jgi:NAD(P)-dependent dehydrogenase (short-subunit alcohol dehydrogenase family)
MEKWEIDLSGKTAIVTGAGQGIGKEVALALAQNGAKVFAADINLETVNKLKTEGEKRFGRGNLEISVTNVASLEDLEAMVGKCVEVFGGIDILVNNAGILHSTKIEEITEEEWNRILAVNLKSVFFAAQKTLPYMKKKKWGRIINMSSLAGRMGGYANGLAYSASKAGIIGLSQGMARRVAEHNITVNTIAPGTTESEIINQFSQDAKDKLKELIPLGRLGQTQDIAGLVLFLSSDLAGFITGAVIDINGGMYMG